MYTFRTIHRNPEGNHRAQGESAEVSLLDTEAVKLSEEICRRLSEGELPVLERTAASAGTSITTARKPAGSASI